MRALADLQRAELRLIASALPLMASAPSSGFGVLLGASGARRAPGVVRYAVTPTWEGTIPHKARRTRSHACADNPVDRRCLRSLLLPQPHASHPAAHRCMRLYAALTRHLRR
jgi:hypothetical protein